MVRCAGAMTSTSLRDTAVGEKESLPVAAAGATDAAAAGPRRVPRSEKRRERRTWSNQVLMRRCQSLWKWPLGMTLLCFTIFDQLLHMRYTRVVSRRAPLPAQREGRRPPALYTQTEPPPAHLRGKLRRNLRAIWNLAARNPPRAGARLANWWFPQPVLPFHLVLLWAAAPANHVRPLRFP